MPRFPIDSAAEADSTAAVDSAAPDTGATPETAPAPEGMTGASGPDAGATAAAEAPAGAGAVGSDAPASDTTASDPGAGPPPATGPAEAPADNPSLPASSGAPDVTAAVDAAPLPEPPPVTTPPVPSVVTGTAAPESAFTPSGVMGTTPPVPTGTRVVPATEREPNPLDVGQVRDGQPDAHPEVRYDPASGRFYFLTAEGGIVWQDVPAGYRYDERNGVLVEDANAPGTVTEPEEDWLPGEDEGEDEEEIILTVVHSRIGDIAGQGERVSAAELRRRNPNIDLSRLVQIGAVRRVREGEGAR